MALVAYSDESDYSDIEESQNCITTPKVVKNIENIADHSDEDLEVQRNGNGIESKKDINVLEQETVIETEFEVDEDEVTDVPTVKTWDIIKNSETLSKTDKIFSNKSHDKNSKKKLKFVLPSLSEFDDEEEEEDLRDKDLSRKKLRPSAEGTGLFSLLPKPRSVTSLVPLNVSRKKAKLPEKPKVKRQNITPVASHDSDDEFPSNSESNDFFSLTDSRSPVPEPLIEPPKININPPIICPVQGNLPTPEPTFYIEPEPINEEPVPSVSNITENTSAKNENSSGIDANILRRLAGRRNAGEVPNIIDIKADDALMSRDEWVTRALCDEKPKKSFSKKREGNPTQQQKRKHQITYLAHQAQEREQDLQNNWGQNRFTKMQTQSKYGF